MLKPRIKVLMVEHNLKREDVAASVGVSVDQVSRWCNGKSYPHMDKAFALAKLFNCDIKDLYKEE